MFAARFAILALLTFLAGANAGCPTCQEIFEVGDEVYILTNCMRSGDASGYTVCIYQSSLNDDEAECEYNKDGVLVVGDSVCPKISVVDPSELGL
ncbi:hypothetical protein EV702DRAFT_1203227 [Suillus placidus]|uniref:Uncharacterized protein n=1 Tax=Suillus placidus TaxID=48579 RepID=A0A9P7CWK7_9AGAM|nr:hypothetical protein EV702DRAFT_1203227 [Suillus placidus]